MTARPRKTPKDATCTACGRALTVSIAVEREAVVREDGSLGPFRDAGVISHIGEHAFLQCRNCRADMPEGLQQALRKSAMGSDGEGER